MTFQQILLGDFITLKRGYDLPNNDRKDGAVPVVSSSGVTGTHAEAKIKGPGVVTGRYGTLGEVFFIEQDFWPLNTALYVQDFKGNSPRFVSYFLRKELMGLLSDKAAVPGVNRNDLHARKVFTETDCAVQEQIAEVLVHYDNAIANNARRIELLERSARLLFEEWFVRLRYPGHEHDKIVNGLPTGWDRSSVGGVCREFIDGDWLESKDQGGDAFRILQISNIGENAFVETGNERYITDETFRRLNCTEVKENDVIISRMPEPIGRAWLVASMAWRMVTAVDVTIARPDSDQVDLHYFLFHLNSRPHIARCKVGATGATRPRIAKRVMAALPILIPPPTLQKGFSSYAGTTNALRTRLIRQNALLTKARDLLLPRLMDGRIEV